MLRLEFTDVVPVLLKVLHARGSIPRTELETLAWDLATRPNVLDGATADQQRHWRRADDRDVQIMLEALGALRLITVGDPEVELTELGWGGGAVRRRRANRCTR